MSSPITSPVDLWKLTKTVRSGTPRGMSWRYQPNAICPSTASAISQCSIIAVRV